MEKLTQKQLALVNQWTECKHMMKGSINDVCYRCNRSNCICSNRANRRAYRLTYKDKNQKTQIVYVPKNKLQYVKKMIKEYARAWEITDQLVQINIKLFKSRLKN